MIHPHEPSVGVFDEEIDVSKQIKQLSQRVLGNETRQDGFLKFLPLDVTRGPGRIYCAFQWKPEPNEMR